MLKKQGFALPSLIPAGKTLPDIQENKVMAATGAKKPRNSAENSALEKGEARAAALPPDERLISGVGVLCKGT